MFFGQTISCLFSLYNYPVTLYYVSIIFFFFSSRRRHTRYWRDWSSDVCSSDLRQGADGFGSAGPVQAGRHGGFDERLQHQWILRRRRALSAPPGDGPLEHRRWKNSPGEAFRLIIHGNGSPAEPASPRRRIQLQAYEIMRVASPQGLVGLRAVQQIIVLGAFGNRLLDRQAHGHKPHALLPVGRIESGLIKIKF